MRELSSIALLVLSVAGCDGTIGDVPGGPSPMVPVPPEVVPVGELPPDVAAVGHRRLSRREIRNSIHDLVGMAPAALNDIPSGIETQELGDRHIRALAALSDEIAASLSAGELTERFDACTEASRACAESFVDGTAARAHRVALSADERAELLAFYELGENDTDGVRAVVAAVFRHPRFLYILEDSTEPGEGPRRLGGFEVAARLSFSICETVPDAELLRAAGEGELDGVEGVREQAVRLLDLPCAARTMEHFYDEWLHLPDVRSHLRDADLFPEFSDELAAAMVEEAHRLLHHLTFETDGTLQEAFSVDYTFANEVLAPVYGALVDGNTDFERIDLPETRRGVLSLPAFLTAHPNQERATSPINRGAFVLEHILCTEIPNVPEDLEIVPPPYDPGRSSRETWEAHTEEEQCQRCHRAINAVGFSMEDFDAIGRYREVDNGHAVDAGGAVSAGDEQVAVDGAAELSLAIASSPSVMHCFAERLVHAGLARSIGAEDAQSVAVVREALSTSSIREALIARATSYSFLHRRTPEGESP